MLYIDGAFYHHESMTKILIKKISFFWRVAIRGLELCAPFITRTTHLEEKSENFSFQVHVAYSDS